MSIVWNYPAVIQRQTEISRGRPAARTAFAAPQRRSLRSQLVLWQLGRNGNQKLGSRGQKRQVPGKTPHFRCCLVAKPCPTLLWPLDCQAPLSLGFLRQEYCSGLPFPFPGDLPDPGTELRSSTLQAGSLPSEPPGNPFSISLCLIWFVYLFCFLFGWFFCFYIPNSSEIIGNFLSVFGLFHLI